VPLSEHEQRLLDQIEQALYAEDPKFASSVRSARRPRNRTRTLLAISVVGVLAGLAVVLVGLTRNLIVLGVLGFVLIVGSCFAAVTALRGPRQDSPLTVAGRPTESRPSKSQGLRSRMEDRMRRRFDES